ncbi:TM2 domain-containing protein [Metamycoplasma subdolum]|uniref:TM2 domain-containing protein n=1 Tax=Metamycoplasma subdolum TaxID=92407 RepID=A0A3L9ZXG2_9BACT|nr:TM2 domain-containing protein [Metamycoplasma subdolum]RMA77571.1 TM2 domain-containing protein [Metamycoplasma subdolum]WPB50365.1 TM2 domain-containing protein [Metamycoplasma subdolum]
MATKPKKSTYWLLVLLLSIFLGIFGIDRFYTQRWVLGILKFITLGGFLIWWIVDIVLIATSHSSYTDATGKKIQ